MQFKIYSHLQNEMFKAIRLTYQTNYNTFLNTPNVGSITNIKN